MISYRNKEKSSKLKKNDSIPQFLSCETFNYHLNILICGDSGVGKSALMIRYTENEFDRFHIVSIAVENGSKVLKIKGKIFKLNFFVAPGDPTYTQDITSLYNQADCILFVFDFTNKLSFTSIINSRERLLRNENKDCRHFVVGNKCESKSKDFISLDYKNYCENSKLQYFEISVKNNINIDKMFLKICEDFSRDL
jgi:small GTP-binding protein